MTSNITPFVVFEGGEKQFKVGAIADFCGVSRDDIWNWIYREAFPFEVSRHGRGRVASIAEADVLGAFIFISMGLALSPRVALDFYSDDFRVLHSADVSVGALRITLHFAGAREKYSVFMKEAQANENRA